MKKQKPVHVGIIPDGNRRWAVAHGLSKADGYHYGLEPGFAFCSRQKCMEYKNSHIMASP